MKQQNNIQENLAKANNLINKALKTNPPRISSIEFAVGHLLEVIKELESKENFKEQESIINSENKNKKEN